MVERMSSSDLWTWLTTSGRGLTGLGGLLWMLVNSLPTMGMRRPPEYMALLRRRSWLPGSTLTRKRYWRRVILSKKFEADDLQGTENVLLASSGG